MTRVTGWRPLWPRGVAPFAIAVAALALGGLPGAARAQDIEAVARARGLVLPRGYWDRIASDPEAFELPNGLFRTPMKLGEPRRPVTGTARLPVVLALFSDSREPEITPEAVRTSLFTGPTARGTMTDFYTEVSRGRFTVDGTVFPWVRTTLPLAEVVGSSYGLGVEASTGRYLREALTLVDPDVDFSEFDNDGPDGLPDSGDDDGVVDAVVFEFLEVSASCGGPAIWPHRSSLRDLTRRPYVTDDSGADDTPIQVNGYIIQGVTDCGGTQIQDASTIAHEFGHVLGLPDYYHPITGIEAENRRWVLGCWALMAAGAWGCGPLESNPGPFGPTHMISWSKHWLGWLDYVDVGSVHDAEYVLGPVETTGTALRIPLDDAGEESLLLELRARASFDTDIPATGVLVVHQDLDGVMRPETGDRYFLRLAEADGNRSLLRTAPEGGSLGEPGDAFGVGGVVGRMNAETNPSTVRNAGTPSTVTIHSIALVGNEARIHVSTAPDPRLVVPEGGLSTRWISPFERHVRIAGGAAPYGVTVEGAPPPGLSVSASQDELVIEGEPGQMGAFDIAVRIVDALGSPGQGVVTLNVGPFVVVDASLLATLLDDEEGGLTAAEQEHLDGLGNGNGRFDIGDARAWLMGG